MRPLIQILLSLGTLLLAPFACMFLLAPFTPSFWSSLLAASPTEAYFGIIFPVGAFGIIALWISIFTSVSFRQRHATLKKVIIAGLVGGAVTSVTCLASTVPQRFSAHTYSRILEDAWIYGGPLVVAIWNILRFWKEPNKAVQTTAMTHPPSTTTQAPLSDL